MLHCITGKSPTHQQLTEEGVDLPRWVQSITDQQSPSQVFDPELAGHQSEGNENMIRLLKIGISCTAQYPDSRPSMAEVTRLIEEVSHSSGSPNPVSGWVFAGGHNWLISKLFAAKTAFSPIVFTSSPPFFFPLFVGVLLRSLILEPQIEMRLMIFLLLLLFLIQFKKNVYNKYWSCHFFV